MSLKNINILIDIGLKIYRLNNDIIGILLPFEFIFNENFIINVLLFNETLSSWKELFENNSWKLSDRKINYLLKSIDKYKEDNNNLSKMYLYLFNISSNNDSSKKYKFNIEGIDIKYYSSNKICCYRYITNQYIPLDKFDTLC